MTLSTGQLAALHNLADKKAGGDVGWVQIAAARQLTDLGLAARNRSGWEITTSGEAVLGREGGDVRSDDPYEILPLRRSDRWPTR